MISNNRCEYIYRKSCEFLLKSEIICLPVNPIDIIKKFHWGLVTYSELCSITGTDVTVEDISDACRSRDGFTVFSGGNYCIAYNDKIRVKSRITFTLMHEAGHIVCGHFQQQESKNICYRDFECEANLFASNVLAPAAVVTECGFDTPELLQKACGLSHNAAKARLNELSGYRINSGDMDILKAFSSYIKICARRANTESADILFDSAGL